MLLLVLLVLLLLVVVVVLLVLLVQCAFFEAKGVCASRSRAHL